MSKVWRWVAIAFSVLMIFGIALLAVAYATGGSFERLIQTTDIADMTKFVSRDQLCDCRVPLFRRGIRCCIKKTLNILY